MFDSIAGRYDALNRIMTLGIDISWRKRMVRSVARGGARNVLDVATGTADLALMLAEAIPSGHVTGVDMSEGMLAVGRAKVAKKGMEGRITLLKEDAGNLSLADGTFDAVTAAFGVRNFENIARGIEEMHRVLVPGGGVYILELGRPRNKIFGTFFRWYFHGVLPLVGRIVSGNQGAYTYLPQSVDGFPCGDAFLKIMEEAGFVQCSFKNLFGGVANIYYGKKI